MNKYLLEDLNYITQRLGTTKAHIWPFVEFEGTNVAGFSIAGDLTAAETGGTAEALEDDFEPLLLPCGLYAYWFNPTGDHHLAGADHADLSFEGDDAFSVGAWIMPVDIGNNRTIISKFNAAGNAEEWALRIDSAAGALELELHDASASATEIAQSSISLTALRWQFVCATYDGTQTAPDVHLYIEGKDQNATGATTEDGSYVAMEDTATPLLIGASGTTGTPAEEFHGYIALPFLTGKELTPQEVLEISNITRRMVMGK